MSFITALITATTAIWIRSNYGNMDMTIFLIIMIVVASIAGKEKTEDKTDEEIHKESKPPNRK